MITWGEFKEIVDKHITNETKIGYIDVSYPEKESFKVGFNYEHEARIIDE